MQLTLIDSGWPVLGSLYFVMLDSAEHFFIVSSWLAASNFILLTQVG